MIPIKIRCGCGQKYAFDVEPVDGVMGYAVQCPVCGVDGTATANQLIAERLLAQTPSAPALRLGRHESPAAAQPPIPRSLPAMATACRSPAGKARKSWVLRSVGGGMVAVCIGAALLARGLGLNQKSRNPAAAQNDGFPHTLAELNAWYVEPPSGQNAAIFFSEGIKALRLVETESSALPLLGKGKLPALGSPMPVSVKSGLTGLVGANREALQFFAQGARFKQSRYPVDLSLGVEATFPHLTRMKEATQFLELAALLHAEANDTKSSADDLSSALGLASSLRAEPYLSSQLVRGRVISIAVAGLERSVNRARWSDETLTEVFSALQKMENYDANGEGFNRGVIGDRVAAMAMLAKPEKFLDLLPALGVDIPPERRARMAERLQRGKLQAEEHFFEEAMTKLMEARQQPFPDRLRADDLIRQQIGAAESKQLVLIDFLLSGFKTEAAKEAECVASLRLGLTAIALEQFQSFHDHRYPASLSELSPSLLAATPIDPFDGQPLRYKTKVDGYVLSSIGPDLKDNVGQRMQGKERDIVFTMAASTKSSK